MSLPNTTPGDYVGEYQIATNKNTSKKLEGYITRYEKYYLYQLLGCELADLYIADLQAGGIPQDPRFVAIYEEFCEQDECGYMYISRGIKEMLTGLVYFEYVKNNNSIVGSSGNVSKEGENSKEASAWKHDLFNRHNIAVETATAIQWYICDNMTVYPEFKGVEILLNHWSL